MRENHKFEGPDFQGTAERWSNRRPSVGAAVIRRFLVVGLLAMGVLVAPGASKGAQFGVGVSVRIGPPALPVYEQPSCPGPGYLWTPGYWSYDPTDGYFWVPGTWVTPPEPGLLWTPGYWGWGGSAFIWHVGYWGPHVGFYGGINYGFGYPGMGFVGGEWRGRDFYYNRAVMNVTQVHITNVYYRQVNNYTVNHVSYNGGPGGLNARPGRNEMDAERERHFQATPMQEHNATAAHNQRSQFANVNHGQPQIAAARKPGEFSGNSVVRATRAGGPVNRGGAGSSANPAANHGASAANPGARNAHQGGPSGRQNLPQAQSHGTSQGQFHAAEPSHNASPRGVTPNAHPQVHQQPQIQNARPSEVGKSQARPQEHQAPEKRQPERQEPDKRQPERQR